jgi:elongation factor G
LIDTPGYPDFAGQSIAALAGVEKAIVVVNAQTGVELMTERKLCRMIVINKIDADNLDLPGLVADIRERFGKQCMLLDLPAHGAADVVEVLEHAAGDADFESVAVAHRALIDQIVEEYEDLLAQYLEDGADPSAAALHAPFEKALREGHLIPIRAALPSSINGVAASKSSRKGAIGRACQSFAR